MIPRNGKLIWSIQDSYKTYTGNIDKRKYTRVLKDFFWEISFAIIRDKYTFMMPRLGMIFIKKKRCNSKTTNLRIDYQHYNKTGEKILLINTHTDGYYFRFRWKKPCTGNTQFRNDGLYIFEPIRGEDKMIGKRGLANWIKRCSIDPTLKDYTTV